MPVFGATRPGRSPSSSVPSGTPLSSCGSRPTVLRGHGYLSSQGPARSRPAGGGAPDGSTEHQSLRYLRASLRPRPWRMRRRRSQRIGGAPVLLRRDLAPSLCRAGLSSTGWDAARSGRCESTSPGAPCRADRTRRMTGAITTRSSPAQRGTASGNLQPSTAHRCGPSRPPSTRRSAADSRNSGISSAPRWAATDRTAPSGREHPRLRRSNRSPTGRSGTSRTRRSSGSRLPTRAGYLALLRGFDSAARDADPSARIVLGGLFPTPHGGIEMTDFVSALYRGGGKDLFGSVALHPYAATPQDALAWVEQMRAALDRLGDPHCPPLDHRGRLGHRRAALRSDGWSPSTRPTP